MESLIPNSPVTETMITGPAIIVEILDRFGKIRERHRLDNFPCRIGRDYSNDIIIDDAYVSPTHIELKLDDQNKPIVSDLNSDNGLFTLHPLKMHRTININNDLRIRIGHTDIRFRFQDHPVRQTTIEHNKPSQISMLLSNVLLLPLVWGIMGMAFMLNRYLAATSEITINELFGSILPVFIFMGLWAFAWSIVSKIVTHHYYFVFHAIWVCLLTFASFLLENMAQYIEFGFALHGSAGYMTFIIEIIMTSILLYGHLHYSTTFTPSRAKFIATITSVVIIGLVELTLYLQKPVFSNQPKYSSLLKPPMFAFSRAQSLTTFFDNSQSLKIKIDKLVMSANKP